MVPTKVGWGFLKFSLFNFADIFFFIYVNMGPHWEGKNQNAISSTVVKCLQPNFCQAAGSGPHKRWLFFFFGNSDLAQSYWNFKFHIVDNNKNQMLQLVVAETGLNLGFGYACGPHISYLWPRDVQGHLEVILCTCNFCERTTVKKLAFSFLH